MCIILLTTTHPSYSLILLSNRDEYLSRPTAPAAWWSPSLDPALTSIHESSTSISTDHPSTPNYHSPPPSPTILSGRDLRHPSHGTWLGITRTGRIACLTNFREEDEDRVTTISSTTTPTTAPVNANKNPHPVDTTATATARSRGEITKAFLTSATPAEVWAEQFLKEQEDGAWGDMRGFSLIFGEVGHYGSSRGDGNVRERIDVKLGVLDNRTKGMNGVRWIAGGGKEETTGFTCALSNSHFGDVTWPKVVKGEELLDGLLSSPGTADLRPSELTERCLDILSTDTMPSRQENESWAVYSRQLRRSILVPKIGAGEEWYATQKQTVVLVGRDGGCRFTERSLWDEKGEGVDAEERDRVFEFDVSTSCAVD